MVHCIFVSIWRQQCRDGQYLNFDIILKQKITIIMVIVSIFAFELCTMYKSVQFVLQVLQNAS